MNAHSWRIVLLALLSLPSAWAAPHPVRIAGTGTGVAVMRLLAAQFEKEQADVKVQVHPSIGSTGGIRAVADGRIDLACASRAMSREEASRGLIEWEFARTPFVFAVRGSRVEPSFTLDRACALFSGQVANWSNHDPVRVVLRPKSDTAHAQLAGISPDMEAALAAAHAVPGAIIAMTDQDAADQLEKTPGSLGTLNLGLILAERRQLRPLALAGIEPSIENLEAGRYPHATVLRLMLRKGEKVSSLTRFLRFLGSRGAHQILRRNGFLPAAAVPSQ